MRLNAREHRARAAPTTSTLATIDHRATSLGPRCAIATSTATIRVPVDHPTIRPSTIANVSGTAVDATRPSAKFPPKKKFEASSPADVPPSRRAHQERRGEFAMRLF